MVWKLYTAFYHVIGGNRVTIFKALIMGIIQGVTEFLPVSSSGHLAIFKHILKFNTETGLLFDVLLHFGTLVAIFIAFYKDLKELFMEGIGLVVDLFFNCFVLITHLFHNSKTEYRKVCDTQYRKFVVLIIISSIPTAILGFAMKDRIESFGNSVLMPGICLIITGLLLLICNGLPNGKKNLDTTGYQEAFAVGVSQGIATLPGLSRSGTTITVCRFLGLEQEFAVKYSFLMSIPAVLGAAILECKDLNGTNITSTEVSYYVVGMIVAAIVGFMCIKSMLLIVRRKKFTYFAFYCIIAGIIAVSYYISTIY